MNILNVEIKARTENIDRLRQILENEEADFRGTDHQIDTYFNVPDGRLKLREGNIENNLIFYHRSDEQQPRKSDVQLYPVKQADELKQLLTVALGIKVIVDKRRDIFFIDNVKFHLDTVKDLGDFVEIEAIDRAGEREEATLGEQCSQYMQLLEIPESDLVAYSYSDLLTDEGGIMF